jgi:hypothetical protein
MDHEPPTTVCPYITVCLYIPSTTPLPSYTPSGRCGAPRVSPSPVPQSPVIPQIPEKKKRYRRGRRGVECRLGGLLEWEVE